MVIEPAAPRPPNLSLQAKKEYSRADSVTDRFERILSQPKALARINQQRYEDKANAHREEASLFKVGDMVLVSVENMKINRPKKSDDKWNGPFKVHSNLGFTQTRIRAAV